MSAETEQLWREYEEAILNQPWLRALRRLEGLHWHEGYPAREVSDGRWIFALPQTFGKIKLGVGPPNQWLMLDTTY